ncbi:hypothetical protein KC330_g127 [Hortaea werneckii]|nr:hypothetical protein KC330_g127 [Hortaea werneckii]
MQSGSEEAFSGRRRVSEAAPENPSLPDSPAPRAPHSLQPTGFATIYGAVHTELTPVAIVNLISDHDPLRCMLSHNASPVPLPGLDSPRDLSAFCNPIGPGSWSGLRVVQHLPSIHAPCLRFRRFLLFPLISVFALLVHSPSTHLVSVIHRFTQSSVASPEICMRNTPGSARNTIDSRTKPLDALQYSSSSLTVLSHLHRILYDLP